MADILKLITKRDLLDFGENFNYQTNFKLSSITRQSKSDNIKFAITRLMENGNLPVIAKVHADDTEARIGERTNFSVFEFEKFLIKEKINLTERQAELVDFGIQDDNRIVKYIFDDISNMTSRVLTRAELMNNQLLSTGKVEINENNYKTTLDFKLHDYQNVDFKDWDDPKHSIIADLKNVKNVARQHGKTITRALTSQAVVDLLEKNEEILTYFKNATTLVTQEVIVAWIRNNLGIAIDVNEDLYREDATSSATHRFFPNNKIAFFTGTGVFIEGLWGVTSEERMLRTELGIKTMTRGYTTITQWAEPDPAAIWTKASGVYVPVPRDVDGLYIATVYKKKTV